MNMYFNKVLTISAFFAISLLSLNAQTLKKQNPLIIESQGSFAIGGTVVTTPGIFDPIQQGAYNPAGTDPTGQT
ncbi:hypothetical protein, partial [Brevibacillus sp. SIMBA_040]|uniref:hypothetical protein n=1 Tax=Brevibacillus sp. SIMBA_040 TaxID=3085781 RepID=UPI00397DBE66